MTQEANGKRDAKHIQVELSAEGARVTGLSLQGSRLLLTIEAELADSALSTAGDPASAPPAQAPVPAPTPAKHTEIVPPAGNAVSIPIVDATETPSHIGHFVSSYPPEGSAPAPEEADETETKDLADIDRETVMVVNRPSGIVELDKVYSTGVESVTDTQSGADTVVSTTDIMGSVEEEDVMMTVPASGANVHAAPPLPPVPPAAGPDAAGAAAEPAPASESVPTVEERADAPDPLQRNDTTRPDYATVDASANQRRYDTGTTQITPTDLRDLLPPETLVEDELEMPTVELPPPQLPPFVPEVPEPAGEPREIAAPEPEPAAEPEAELPAPPPMPELEAPEPEPELAPEPPEQEPVAPECAAPQVMQVTPDPASEAHEDDDDGASWREIDIPALSEESNTVGGDRHGEPMPAMAFGLDLSDPEPVAGPVAAPLPPLPPRAEPEPQPEPEPEAEPEPAAKAEPEPEPVAPPPLPEPEPQPAPLPPPPPLPPFPGDDGEEPSNPGTTVLIRYTCPKCKTQGMQAVDKVGTVVNCSNCGKPMRLVMKK